MTEEDMYVTEVENTSSFTVINSRNFDLEFLNGKQNGLNWYVMECKNTSDAVYGTAKTLALFFQYVADYFDAVAFEEEQAHGN